MDPNLLLNNVVKGSLVALPAENSFGILFYNLDLLARVGADPQADTLTQFEEQFFTLLQQLKGQDVFDKYGISVNLGMLNADYSWRGVDCGSGRMAWQQ